MDKFNFKPEENIPKALLSGATYALGSMLVFPEDISATVNILGVRVPILLVSSLAGFVGSLSGDIIGGLLYPNIPASVRIKSGTAASIDALSHGFIESSLLAFLIGAPMVNYPSMLTYAVAQGAANEWLYQEIFGASGFNLF